MKGGEEGTEEERGEEGERLIYFIRRGRGEGEVKRKAREGTERE
jgi:hypothetical protein